MTSRRQAAKPDWLRHLLERLRGGALATRPAATRYLPATPSVLAEQLRANERIWAGFRALELRMLAAGSLAEILAILTQELPQRFPAVQRVSLAWHDADFEIGRLLDQDRNGSPDGIVVLSAQDLAGQVPDTAPWLGPAEAATQHLFFPQYRQPFGSLAIAPLRLRGERVGALVQGSLDSGHFTPEAATDLLEHLAAVTAICVDNAVNRARLQHDVLTDPLTSVANRRFFERRLAEEVSLWQRQGGCLSCLLLDLDHFKQINDRHGHPAGDAALRQVAQLLGESLRVSDVLARYGGEEFALLLPATDTEQAREIAERLRVRIANQPLVLADGLEWPVTVSVGCATLANGNDRGVESAAVWLLRSADSALYAAKAGGRNRAASAAPQDA